MSSPTVMGPEFIDIGWRQRQVRIEYAWIARERKQSPLIVFLHEGLGSLSMWKDFPARLCHEAGARGLVYSRPGYGRSTPRAAHEVWANDFMHRQAHEVLPALLAALDVDIRHDKPWLLGHSDGGSIALLHAAAHPDNVAGVIVLAPHIMVEDVSLKSIAEARTAYLDADLKSRLGKHHDDPDSAFWGWNDVWLSPAFRSWSIEQEIKAIRCPVLAIQGTDDPYGTMAQVQGIADVVPRTALLALAHCGHAPHRDQAAAVVRAATSFIGTHTSR